jgi:hypothetical protein
MRGTNMRRILGLSLALAASFAAAGAAHAQTVTAKEPSSIVDVLQKNGYRAELTKDESGDPMIRSASSGTNFIILFYGCTANRNCATVQFYAGFTEPKSASIDSLNTWNANNRFGRAYLSDKGAARLEMDVDLDDGGMSAALFEDNVEFWIAILASFEKHISGG